MSKQTAQFSFYTVYAEDAFGNSFTVVVDDLSDTVQVYGLMESEYTPFSFESEAYHLSSATQGTSIKYAISKQTQTVEIVFD